MLACGQNTGAGFIYFRSYLNNHTMGSNFTWVLNQTYASPAGENGHFGYSVGIHPNYSIFGAYGYGMSLYL